MINLYISLYPEQNPIRNSEYTLCLEKNLERFNNIFILTEGDVELPNNCHLLPVTCRPTYRTFFNVINTVSQPDDINIIANSDIWFENIKEPMSHQCFALTRYEPTYFLNRRDSQDAWVFRGHIKPVEYCDFGLGIPGCDNRIARELLVSGYEVTNPSLTMVTHHVHSNPTHHTRIKVVAPPYFKPEICE